MTESMYVQKIAAEVVKGMGKEGGGVVWGGV